MFNVLVAILCAGYWSYSETGTLGLDWGFLESEIQIFENSIAN